MSNNMLQYGKQYAEYAKKNCKKIVQGSYSAYFAYCNVQNMQNMSNNMLPYAQQYANYAFFWRDLSICLASEEVLMRSQ
jgi:hypothetical protein